MTSTSNFQQASAIADSLGATLTRINPETASYETYVLDLKANKRARLTLQFGRTRRPDLMFFDVMFPGDVMRAGVRKSRHYRIVTEMNEANSASEMDAPINGNPTQIAVDVERHLIRDYLTILERVLPFFPEAPLTVAGAAENRENYPLVGQLAT